MSSKMKSLLGMYAMAAMSMADTPYHEPTKEEKKKQRVDDEIALHKKNGLKEFFYGEHGENSLWALNQKTADKKAKKKGWL